LYLAVREPGRRRIENRGSSTQYDALRMRGCIREARERSEVVPVGRTLIDRAGIDVVAKTIVEREPSACAPIVVRKGVKICETIALPIARLRKLRSDDRAASVTRGKSTIGDKRKNISIVDAA